MTKANNQVQHNYYISETSSYKSPNNVYKFGDNLAVLILSELILWLRL